ncbi:MAG TPA: hypothetical protein VHR42_00645 [Clostridia bacterium]|nr:hypothetical protein [Clostridia bacterium]
MSILEELNTLLTGIGLSVETGMFSGAPPDEYLVITPLADTFEGYADDLPQQEIQEVRLSLFSKGSYTARKNQIVRSLLENNFTVMDRRYIGHEDDTNFHQYAIDVAKEYEMGDE